MSAGNLFKIPITSCKYGYFFTCINSYRFYNIAFCVIEKLAYFYYQIIMDN